MSQLLVDDITDAAGTGAPTFSQGIDLGSRQGVWARKELSTNVTATGTMTDLTFTNIESGVTYRLDLHVITTVGTSGRTLVRVRQGATVLTRIDISNTTGTTAQESGHSSLIFRSASTSDITVDLDILSGGGSPEVAGSGDLDGSWFQIEEVDDIFLNPTETTKWD